MASVLLMRILWLLVATSTILAADLRHWPQSTCRHPIIRKEWRTLKKTVQKEYLNAVHCMMEKRAITPKSISRGAVSRYDDFAATHILQTLSIHHVGDFLPWHRYFTAMYEKSLREECGYTGAQPYWDWNVDVPPFGNFTQSPLWDAEFGFGGNGPYEVSPPNPLFPVPGQTGGGCVIDGPFKDIVVNMGPRNNVTGNPRCLSRDFSPYIAETFLGRNATKVALSQPDFGSFDLVIEGSLIDKTFGMHGGGHFAIGGTLGEMGDLYSSPADPLFYLHHANLDRVWWSWQNKDLSRRLHEISGPVIANDYNNTLGGNVTLSFPLSLGVNAPNVTIRDVMDIRAGTLCYDYDELYHF